MKSLVSFQLFAEIFHLPQHPPHCICKCTKIFSGFALCLNLSSTICGPFFLVFVRVVSFVVCLRLSLVNFILKRLYAANNETSIPYVKRLLNIETCQFEPVKTFNFTAEILEWQHNNWGPWLPHSL